MVYKKWIGILLVVILSSSVYFVLPDKLKISVEKTNTKYYVYTNDSWDLAATEYVYLFDGTTKMRAKTRELSYFIDSENNVTYINRTSTWKDNITTIDEYVFSGMVNDIRKIPIRHTVNCINCVGKILQFEYRDISYFNETKKITSPFSFEKHMELDWQDGAYYSKVFQQKSSDKIIIKYRPKYDVDFFDVRLYDPPLIYNVYEDGVRKQYIYDERVVFVDPVYSKDDMNWSKGYSYIEKDLVRVRETKYRTNKFKGVYKDKEIKKNAYVNKEKASFWNVPIGNRDLEKDGTCYPSDVRTGVCGVIDLQ